MADPVTYRPKTADIPAEPGVYRFSDGAGRVIYVGKAVSLRSRLTSYFQDPANLHPRTRTMVFSATHVDWTTVRNELEALQLEYTWIKQYDPRFNIKYRDDKSYPWLCVTWSEDFPRVFVGRGQQRKGWRYFGPYAEAWAIRDSVDTLLTVFPMRSCSPGVFRSAKAAGRPCLMGYIDKCAAPCVGRIEAGAHRQIAADFCQVIDGHAARFIRGLTDQMTAAAASEDYEKAAVLRDQIDALTRVNERNAVVLEASADLDVVALALDPLEVAVELFHVRSGRILAERSWVADRADDADEAQLVEAFLLQIYGDVEGTPEERRRALPPEILVTALPATAAVLSELLSGARGSLVGLRQPRRGAKKALLTTAQRNADQTLALHKARRASDLTTRNQALGEIADVLGLAEVPLRIECYDISHIQGTNTVASMVVFEDGLARKSQYRHFAITSVASNDVGAMKEVLTRRFSRLTAERATLADQDRAGLIDSASRQAKSFAYEPALVVVDGGAPQVAVARATLDDLGFAAIPVVGLAKRLEELWLAGEEYPAILPRTSPGLYLLQHIRDESHRFAITYHRQRRSRSMVESLLDGVPGLGEVRRKALFRAFASLRQLRAATPEQIAQVPGFGPVLAEAVAAAVAEQPGGVNLTTGELLD